MALQLETSKTALVLIDLQHGILAMPMQPHAAADVLANTGKLADAFRAKGAPVIFVRVDLAASNQLVTDMPHDASAPPPPKEASELVPQAGRQPDEVLITKHFWGAFGRTDLERELRSRGVTTIVLGGVMTSIGVESTAREAGALGFNVVLAEDACASLDAEGHTNTVTRIIPLLGRVRSTAEIAAAIA